MMQLNGLRKRIELLRVLMMSKGSNRRKENTKQVEKNLEQVKFGKRDKSGDTFKVNVRGKNGNN